MKITPRPALYFLIPYLLGVIAGSWTSIPFLWLWFSVLLSFIGSLAARNRRRYLSYGLLHLAVFAGGMLRLETAAVSPIPDHFHDKPVTFSGTTTYQPERGAAWDECYAVGECQLLSDASARVKAKLLIRFQEPVPLRYGQRVTLTGVLQEPRGKRNPGGFDYKAYLARQDVVGVVEAIGLLRIGEQGGFLPLRWIEALRIQAERLIDAIYAEVSLHAQLVKGILLGKRSGIPSETLDTFQNSGTFHVLAVSGLHVGLVAAFCYFGFSGFRLPQKIVCLLTIIAVLIYACLVGFRPSVFRAGVADNPVPLRKADRSGHRYLQSVSVRCTRVAPLEPASVMGCRISTLFRCRCVHRLFRSEDGETFATLLGRHGRLVRRHRRFYPRKVSEQDG